MKIPCVHATENAPCRQDCEICKCAEQGNTHMAIGKMADADAASASEPPRRQLRFDGQSPTKLTAVAENQAVVFLAETPIVRDKSDQRFLQKAGPVEFESARKEIAWSLFEHFHKVCMLYAGMLPANARATPVTFGSLQYCARGKGDQFKCVQCGVVNLNERDEMGTTRLRIGHIVSKKFMLSDPSVKRPRFNFIPICAACNSGGVYGTHNQLSRWAESEHAYRLPAFVNDLWRAVLHIDPNIVDVYPTADIFLFKEYDEPFLPRAEFLLEKVACKPVGGLTAKFWERLRLFRAEDLLRMTQKETKYNLIPFLDVGDDDEDAVAAMAGLSVSVTAV